MNTGGTSRTTSRRQAAPALGAVLGAAVLFRLPPLLNARGVHSDAAVVGLQATPSRH